MRKLFIGIIIGLMIGSFGLSFAEQFIVEIASFPILINGKDFKTDKPIATINGSTYLPLRAIGDALGVKVNWNNDLGRAEIGEMNENKSSEYSYENPASLNVTRSIFINGFIDKYTVEMSVKEIIRGDVALQMLKQANMFNDNPKQGYDYVLAKIYFKVLDMPGGKAFNLSSTSDIKLISSDGKEYEYASVVEPEPKLDSKLYKGSSNEGWAAYQVKTTDTKPKLAFGRKYDGSGGIWFKAYK